jgi:uncharacterized membrane protein
MWRDEMSGFWYGFIAAFSFGTADFLTGRSSRHLGSLLTLLYMQMVGFVLLSGWILIDQQWVGMTQQPMAVLWAILFMGFDILGILCLYQALAKGKLSIVTPIASSFSAVTVVLAILFGERLSWMVLGGIIVTIIGVVIPPYNSHQQRNRGLRKESSGRCWPLYSWERLFLVFEFQQKS